MKQLIAKRGDHAGGWYLTDPVKKRCVQLQHADWAIFDKDGNLAIDLDNKTRCWTTKSVAQWNADNAADWIAGFATPIDCPIEFKALS